ncbi:M55 family metallopeptidase [Romboutsia sp. 1001713B170131_170501_G6]|nr:M55 family metallopeptidase [Romboutsia sp. 1001713B170131_170501_G6]
MKVFINADIEGTCGVVDREEVDISINSCI